MMMKLVLLTVLSVLAATHASADINFNDGASYLINDDFYQSSSIILDDMAEGIDPPNPGTHVDLVNGGSVYNLTAYNNATITVSGGAVTNTFQAYGNASINMSGGSAHGLAVYGNATLSMSGGLVEKYLIAMDNATIAMTNGTVMFGLNTSGTATVTMSGGSVGNELHAYDNSNIILTGGTVGSYLAATENATIYLSGTGFSVNGTSLANGDKLSNFGTGTITGTLADGFSTLDNGFVVYDTADIIIIPEPCSLVLLSLGGLVLRKRRKA